MYECKFCLLVLPVSSIMPFCDRLNMATNSLQKLESILHLPESELVLWCALTNRMRQKWPVTSKLPIPGNFHTHPLEQRHLVEMLGQPPQGWQPCRSERPHGKSNPGTPSTPASPSKNTDMWITPLRTRQPSQSAKWVYINTVSEPSGLRVE